MNRRGFVATVLSLFLPWRSKPAAPVSELRVPDLPPNFHMLQIVPVQWVTRSQCGTGDVTQPVNWIAYKDVYIFLSDAKKKEFLRAAKQAMKS